MNRCLLNVNNLSDTDFKKCLSLMTEERKQYISSVSNEKRRKESLAGEWLVKNMVSELFSLKEEEIVIERDKKGKPYVKGRSIHISISHSGDFVAAAVDTKPIGIDIEVIKPVNLKVAHKVCSEKDLQFILSANNDEERLINFLKIWTAKEAYFKMKGTGITNIKSVSYKDINALHFFEEGLIITVVT